MIIRMDFKPYGASEGNSFSNVVSIRDNTTNIVYGVLLVDHSTLLLHFIVSQSDLPYTEFLSSIPLSKGNYL